jgi:hypothetical protein
MEVPLNEDLFQFIKSLMRLVKEFKVILEDLFGEEKIFWTLALI